MSGLSKREAARQWGKARATIDRDVASGKLSLTPDKLIDPAEMIRVYGEPKGGQQGRSKAEASEPDEATPEATQKATGIMALEAKLKVAEAMLEKEKEERARERADLQRNIDTLTTAMQLLGHDRAPDPKKKRWWQR